MTTKVGKRDGKSSNDMNKNRNDRVAVWISIVALCVATVTGAITGYFAYLSTDTAEKQLRAYAYAAPSGVLNVEIGNPIQGYIWLENSGQTVARSVQVRMGMLVAP